MTDMMTPEESNNFNRLIGLMDEAVKTNAEFLKLFTLLDRRVELLEKQMTAIRTRSI